MADFALGLFTHQGVNGHFGGLGRLGGRRRHSARIAQSLGPHAHRWQWCLGIGGSGHRLGHGSLKSLPHQQELRTRRIQDRGKFHVYAEPLRVGHQGAGLALPLLHIHTQGLHQRLSVLPRFGGEDFNTLG